MWYQHEYVDVNLDSSIVCFCANFTFLDPRISSKSNSIFKITYIIPYEHFILTVLHPFQLPFRLHLLQKPFLLQYVILGK